MKEETFDPFSTVALEKLRLSQNFSELQQVKAVLLTVNCRKPHKQEFVRVRPGEENQFETLTLHDIDSGEIYLVDPSIAEQVAEQLTPVRLVICLSRNSKLPFLWPLKLPIPGSKPNRWHESGIECARLAENEWVKVVSDMPAGHYTPYVAVAALPEPDWSDVPPMNELLKAAFKDRFINTVDHPVVKRLRGET